MGLVEFWHFEKKRICTPSGTDSVVNVIFFAIVYLRKKSIYKPIISYKQAANWSNLCHSTQSIILDVTIKAKLFMNPGVS